MRVGSPHHQSIAAIDYTEKPDSTVGVIVHRMHVVRPSQFCPTPIAWVDRAVAAFPSILFVLDDYQLVSALQKYDKVSVGLGTG